MTADGGEHQAGELLRRRRVLRLVREAFHLDVEAECAPGRQGQDLLQRRDSRSRKRALFRERRVFLCAAVELPHLLQRHLAHDPAAFRTLADGGVEHGVVHDHGNVVARHDHVELEEVGAGFDGVFEGRQRVFRQHRPRPSMAVNGDARRGRDRQNRKKRHHSPQHPRSRILHGGPAREQRERQVWERAGRTEGSER